MQTRSKKPKRKEILSNCSWPYLFTVICYPACYYPVCFCLFIIMFCSKKNVYLLKNSIFEFYRSSLFSSTRATGCFGLRVLAI